MGVNECEREREEGREREREGACEVMLCDCLSPTALGWTEERGERKIERERERERVRVSVRVNQRERDR